MYLSMFSWQLLCSVRRQTMQSPYAALCIDAAMDSVKPQTTDTVVPPANSAAKPPNYNQTLRPIGNKYQVKMAKPLTIEELVFYPRGCQAIDTSSSEVDADYEAAIRELNSLQPNENTIKQSVENPNQDTVSDTIKYLIRSGLPLTTVEQLSFIHVAGTKGKGSTCALTESILRHHGARTGFYSSPHIMSTNERIRINGEPLQKQKFVHHFWHVFNRLQQQREHAADMPSYFKFMTILCFHVFVAEQVDVAVLEVGLGGEKDCTNIVRNVRTVGITSLGLEHTDLLGDTLKQIAWQKAGIIKPNAHVFTHVTQPECLEVIHARAAEKHASVYEVPALETYLEQNQLGDYLASCNDVIRLNGSLAIMLALDWLQQKRGPLQRDTLLHAPALSEELLLGLRNAHWPGRCQLVKFQRLRLHLDGAHTIESMRVCTDWFKKSTKHSQNPKILIFNRIGETDIKSMLFILQQACAFDMVCFVPNVASNKGNCVSQVMLRCGAIYQLKRAQAIALSWQQVCNSLQQPNNSQVYPTLCDAFAAIQARYAANSQPLDVLVTGSIHLLGAAISALHECGQ